MKKIVIITILAILITLTGCGEKDNPVNTGSVGRTTKAISDERMAVSFVCGIRNSYPYYGSLMNPEVQNAAYDVSYCYGDVSIYIIDGDPFIIVSKPIEEPREKVDKEKRRMVAEGNERAILNSISSKDFTAKCDEADTLQAISLSANSLHNSEYESKYMYILDSGLSTTGVLDFAHQNIIDSEPSYVVEKLKEQHAIPNLQGITIRWIGFGQTCGEQQTLSSDYIYKLENIWRAILSEGGAIIDEYSFDKGALENIDIEISLPYVTPVPIVSQPISPQETGEDTNESDNMAYTSFDDGTILALDENTHVNFKPDTAEFIDSELAYRDLESVVEYLKSSSEVKVYVAGMTATYGDRDSCKRLSLERATAVKNLILQSDASISADQMIILGLGYEDNFLRVIDVVNGEFMEDEAKRNRAVYVMGENATGLEQLISIAETI